MKQAPEAFFVHPFNQPSSWNGHSTIVDEIKSQLSEDFNENREPAVIVTVAGGGGLAIGKLNIGSIKQIPRFNKSIGYQMSYFLGKISGILLGIRRHGWTKVPMVVMETEGAKSFNAALHAGEVVKLDAIKSIATSLGSLSIQKELLEMAQSTEFHVISGVVSDRSAVKSCLRFADDHRMLVEPACGAGLSSIYSDDFCNTDPPLKSIPPDNKDPVVLVVCGGDIVSLDLLQKWKGDFSI